MKADRVPVERFVEVRKIPAVVEARRLDGSAEIMTPEGSKGGRAGDVLIRGDGDGVWPCDREAFEQNYEIVSEAHEQGPFDYYTTDGSEAEGAWGCAFPDGSVVVRWPSSRHKIGGDLNAGHFSTFESVDDVMAAYSGNFAWGGWGNK